MREGLNYAGVTELSPALLLLLFYPGGISCFCPLVLFVLGLGVKGRVVHKYRRRSPVTLSSSPLPPPPLEKLHQ
jgi:hypothetical protein